MKKLLPVFIALLLCASCDKETVTTDCLEQALTDFNMVSYTGQELGCNFFVHQYTFRNRQYYMLGNHCVDMTVSPVDCDGNELCDGNNQQACNRFFRRATNHGIVGIRL